MDSGGGGSRLRTLVRESMHHVLWRKTVRGSARGSRSRERIFLRKPWTEIETPTPYYPQGIPTCPRVESRSILHDAQRSPHALVFPPSPSVRLRGQSRPDRGPWSARLWYFRLFEMTVGGWQGRAEPRGPSVSVVCPVSERHRGGKGTDREGEGGSWPAATVLRFSSTRTWTNTRARGPHFCPRKRRSNDVSAPVVDVERRRGKDRSRSEVRRRDE